MIDDQGDLGIRRINSTEFYAIEFYSACALFTLLGGKVDSANSQHIDSGKFKIKTQASHLKNSTPLTQRFAQLIIELIEHRPALVDEVRQELNNNNKRKVLLTKEEFVVFNRTGTRTGWKAHGEHWFYRTGADSTRLSGYIKIIERKIHE